MRKLVFPKELNKLSILHYLLHDLLSCKTLPSPHPPVSNGPHHKELIDIRNLHTKI